MHERRMIFIQVYLDYCCHNGSPTCEVCDFLHDLYIDIKSVVLEGMRKKYGTETLINTTGVLLGAGRLFMGIFRFSYV